MSWGRPAPQTREERIAARQERMAAQAQAAAGRQKNVRAAVRGTTTGITITKEHASQHQGYMAAVRRLGYCMRCKTICRPQFCHADFGKGTGIKTDVRRGWPGCDSCHRLVGSSGVMRKETRRSEEQRLAAETRREILRRGWWPKTLEVWPA